MKTAKQDYALFLPPVQIFTTSLTETLCKIQVLCNHPLQTELLNFQYVYLQAIPQGSSLLGLREQGLQDSDIGYRKKKNSQVLHLLWKVCFHCHLNK